MGNDSTSIRVNKERWILFQKCCLVKKIKPSKYVRKLIDRELFDKREDFQHEADKVDFNLPDYWPEKRQED